MGEFGFTKNLSFLPDGIPITGILGDQQAALLGQAGINPGDMKCTYGTGAFLLLNIGKKIKFSKAGLLTTVAFKYKNRPCYALEGSCYVAGAAVQWLRDNLGIISSAGEIEALANEVKNPDEIRSLFFMPFFTGLGAPYWNPDATGVILGLGRDTQKKHLARACLEGIAFSVNDLVVAFGKDAGIRLKRLNVDGGAVVNNLLMQTQADICNIEISRPRVIETTAYGAGLAAAIGSGLLDLGSLEKFRQEDRRFLPQKSNHGFYRIKKTEWSQLIKKLW
jgi:glycerol kinase